MPPDNASRQGTIPRADSIPDLEDFLSLKPEDYPPLCGSIGCAVLPRAEILFPHGNPRTLKTWAVASMALCLASGKPWMDTFPCEQCRVLYIQADGGRLKWQERIHKLLRGMGLRVSDIEGWFRTDMRNGRVLAFRDHIDGLIEACGDWHPQVAIFDPFARFLAGELDESLPRDMSIFISRIEQFQSAWQDCSLVFLHHDTKNAAKQGGAAMRGAGNLWAAASTCDIIGVSRTKAELSFVLKDYESPPPFVIEVEIGTEIATVQYRGTRESDEHREKVASVLVSLQESPEPLGFRELARLTSLPQTTVRRIVDDCLQRSLVYEAAQGEGNTRRFYPANEDFDALQ